MKTNKFYLILSLLILFSNLLKAEEIPTVLLGTQEWAAVDLKVKTFSNGDPITEVVNWRDWEKLGESKTPVFCTAKGVNGEINYFYNIYAVIDPRGLAPKGFHIPSNDEFKVLVDFLGGSMIAGEKLKSKTGWKEDGNGTNESNLNFTPNGVVASNGIFGSTGEVVVYWTSTVNLYSNTLYSTWYFSSSMKMAYSYAYDRKSGLSVRCIKDK